MDYEVDKTVYLWIKSGTIMDNKNNKTSTIVTGPYAFSPIVFVTYNKTAGVTGCDEKKAVVFEKQYGKNANNTPVPAPFPKDCATNMLFQILNTITPADAKNDNPKLNIHPTNGIAPSIPDIIVNKYV